MKEIKEEWKVIEEFPNNEISNMGRCRYKRHKRGYIIKKTVKNKRKGVYYELFSFMKDGARQSLSPGKMVALYFVPNPEGYKFIRHKDGNSSNCCYLNIEWIKNICPYRNKAKKRYSSDEQIMCLRGYRDRIDRLVEAIKNDKIPGFVYSEVQPIIKQYGIMKLPVNDREEFISFATDYILDVLLRGGAVMAFEKYAEYSVLKFLKYKNGLKTVEFNEAYRKHNMEEY
jgi:hypothetical protein